jgi:hypothetical protein
MGTAGVGLTVIEKDWVLEHPFAVALTVIVPTNEVLPLLTVVKDGIIPPEPEAGKPIAVLLFVQL